MGVFVFYLPLMQQIIPTATYPIPRHYRPSPRHPSGIRRFGGGDTNAASAVFHDQLENVSAETRITGLWQVLALGIGKTDLSIRVRMQAKSILVHHTVMATTK